MASVTIDTDRVSEVLADLRVETRKETLETIAKGLRNGAVLDSQDDRLTRRLIFAIQAMFGRGTPNARAWNVAADAIEAAIVTHDVAVLKQDSHPTPDAV